MSSYKKWIWGILFLVLSVALFRGIRPQKCTGFACNNEYANAPLYSAPGMYPVGTRDLDSNSDSPLQMTMWYPASQQNNQTEASSYPYEIKIGSPVGTVTIATTPGYAVQDAPVDLAQGPYPLVVLSPGFAVGAASYGWLAEHIASYGFVVIAPEHKETLDPQNELWRAAITRPQDILTVFDFVDQQVLSGGVLEGVVDGEETAVIGHSYGGYTALASAGAQIDTASFNTHCEEAIRTDDPTTWLCEMLLPKLADMATLAGYESIPEDLWPNETNPRVDAIVSMAGDAYFFGQTGLSKIDTPILAIGGTLDDDTPFLWGPQPTYEHTSSPTKALLALTDAEHMIFTNTCESIRWYARLLVGEFCADANWNRSLAHDLVAHFTTAFLLTELTQDAAAAAALAPDAAAFPQTTYKAQGY